MKHATWLFTLLLLLFPGCFLPEGEVTPTFELTVDTSVPKYDTLHQSATLADGLITINVGGSADPIPQAVDDEFGDTLRLVLEKKALANVTIGTVYTLAGTTSTHDVSGGWIDTNSLVFTPGTNHLDAVQLIYLARSCFCYFESASFEQSWSGFIRFHEISASQIKATLTLTMHGQIVGFWSNDGSHTAKLEVSFDVAPK
ncbi:MAG: hypothetical protein KC609_26945 [Myxococcales bacterium]|nr:hypothetical protein [Myxococcales bacterium]